jgi:hypothetical protein
VLAHDARLGTNRARFESVVVGGDIDRTAASLGSPG